MKPTNDSLDDQHDHYSVDEMMARLKHHKRSEDGQHDMEDGELITRSDGTQVIKVRKRKRRSQQAPKEAHPKFKWAAIGILTGLVLLLFVFTIFIITKFNGTSFKGKTEISISKVLGANLTKLSQLRVTPISATADEINIIWGDDSFFHKAAFSIINTDIRPTSFFSDSWHGDEMLSEKGVIQLQVPDKNKPQTIENKSSKYQFQSYRCTALDVVFGSYDQPPSIQGMHATLQQLPNTQYQVTFNKGIITIPHWPELNISSGIVTLQPSNAELEARIKANNDHKGELIIKGIVYKDREQPIVLDVKSEAYPMADLLGKDLGQIISGEINSDMGSLSYNPQKKDLSGITFVMPFNSEQLHLQKLPMLNDLRELTDKSHYLHPSFNYCRGSILRSHEGVSLQNLKLISSQLLSIEGNISMSHNGKLSGNLKIGIPSRLFDVENPAPEIFSSPVDGYIYTKVEIGGSIHNPHDDLNMRLKQGRGITPLHRSAYKKLTPSPPFQSPEKSKSKERAFEELTK